MGFKSRYTINQREQAIQLAQVLGNNEAARQLDIDRTTLSRWVREAAKDGPVQTVRDTAAVEMIQEVRKGVLPLARAVQLKALEALDAKLQPDEDGKVAVAAKDLAIIFGIATEKIALAEGKPTSIVDEIRRFETWSDKDLRDYAERGRRPKDALPN